MSDLFASQMWDEVSRDMDAERAELSRTAALADSEKMLWPLVSGAENATDLGHRLALAENTIALIAARRGYPAQDLHEDLTRQWKILAEARAAAAPKPDPAVQRHEAQLRARGEQMNAQAYLKAVSTLTSRAAADNPGVPLAQCQALAEEALSKQANAFPLSYESWGHVPDGPITHGVKSWTPDKLKMKPKDKDPGDPGTGDGGSGMFDEVGSRLDEAERKLNEVRPPVQASTQHAAGPITDRIKGWMPGRRKQQAPMPNGGDETFDEVNDRLDAADRKLNPTKPSEATIPGTVPDLDLSEYLKGPDKAVEENSHGNSAIFDSPMHKVHSDEFADRRIDNGLQGIRDEQARSDATEPSGEDTWANSGRTLDRIKQTRQDMGPQPAYFSHEERPQHAPVPQGSNAAPAFAEPHNHSHIHPSSGSYEQPSLWDHV